MVLALLGLMGGWGCLGGAGEVCTSLHRHTCQCPSSFQHAFSSRHCGCLWAASTGMMTLGLRDQLQDSRNAKKIEYNRLFHMLRAFLPPVRLSLAACASIQHTWTCHQLVFAWAMRTHTRDKCPVWIQWACYMYVRMYLTTYQSNKQSIGLSVS